MNTILNILNTFGSTSEAKNAATGRASEPSKQRVVAAASALGVRTLRDDELQAVGGAGLSDAQGLGKWYKNR